MKKIKFLLIFVLAIFCGSAYTQEVCKIPPVGPPVVERVNKRTYPSIALPGGSSLVEGDPIRWVYWNDFEQTSRYDINYYGFSFDLWWHLTPTEPTYGLSTRFAGDLEHAVSTKQEFLDRNPNFLVLPEIRLHNHFRTDAFPPDSDFWLRNAGQIVKNDVPWDEYSIDILNPKVQQLLIDRVVGVAECGVYDGVLFDAFYPYHAYYYDEVRGIATEQEVIEIYIGILKGIRERVRDDFLILVNRNREKTPQFSEWINGSFMETLRDNPDGYTYDGLIEIENTLLWNEENLREPRINILQGRGVFEPFESPDNLRWMRLFTTMSLTHSDGYSIFRVPKEIDGVMQTVHIWYDFWNADLGRPVGETGQLYENREGLFIREFTNGWAVYNRSGKAQEIELPGLSTGWQSGQQGSVHIVADLDGEIYLKSVVREDLNADGVVNVLDLVIAANAFGKAEPDLNADGVVNVLDLVIVANAF